MDVAATPKALPGALAGSTAIVIDVLRASTTMVTALANGCVAIIPVAEPEDARARVARQPGALVAGERGGEPLAWFDLGNSPLEFTAERVRGRTVVLTTSNGTRALLAVRDAAAVGVAGFVNLSAAAAWALERDQDLVLACAGELGAHSLEDYVCAGLLAERVATLADVSLSPAARDAASRARAYGKDVGRLAKDSSAARRLAARGRGGDVGACLALDVSAVVPVYRADVDKVLSGHP